MGRITPQLVKQRLGLGERHSVDIGVAAAAEIDAFAAGLGMGADQRVQGAGGGTRIVGRGHPGTRIAAAVAGAVMLDPEPGKLPFQRGRQNLVGAIHVEEAGVAAGRRYFERVKHARLGRMLPVGHIGVPHQRGIAETADRDAVIDHVGDDIDLRVAVDETPAVLLDRRRIEGAEAAIEGEQIVAEALAAKQEHQVIEPGAMDRGEAGLVEFAQIDPVHLRRQRMAARDEGHLPGRHKFRWPASVQRLLRFCGRIR
jgi:hypothetical protein